MRRTVSIIIGLVCAAGLVWLVTQALQDPDFRFRRSRPPLSPAARWLFVSAGIAMLLTGARAVWLIARGRFSVDEPWMITLLLTVAVLLALAGVAVIFPFPNI